MATFTTYQGYPELAQHELSPTSLQLSWAWIGLALASQQVSISIANIFQLAANRRYRSHNEAESSQGLGTRIADR